MALSKAAIVRPGEACARRLRSSSALGRGSRWTVRILRLILVATVLAMVAAAHAVSGDAVNRTADQAHDTALQETDDGITGTLADDIGATFGGLIAAVIVMVVVLIVLIVLSTVIAFAGSGGLLFSAVSHSAQRQSARRRRWSRRQAKSGRLRGPCGVGPSGSSHRGSW